MMPYVSRKIVKCRKAREDSKEVKSALLSRFLSFRNVERGKINVSILSQNLTLSDKFRLGKNISLKPLKVLMH